MIYLRPNGDTNSSNEVTINGSGVLSLPSLTASTSVTAPKFISSTNTGGLITPIGTGWSQIWGMEGYELTNATTPNSNFYGIATQYFAPTRHIGFFGAGLENAWIGLHDGSAWFRGNVTASTFIGALTGNASSATALTSNAGSNTNPIYFSLGKPTASTYSFGNASGNIPISNGTLNTNLNADQLDGENSSFFKKRYNTIIKKGIWSRILYATPIALFGSFIVSINYTRNSVVVGNVFLITFGHSGHGQITVLGTHKYTQIQARLTGDANNIYLELFDVGAGTVGDTQTATITLDAINANITTYTSFTD
ncbi:MAG: hypothetical protein WCR33_06410, partial [Bacilli bacterium]